MNSASGFSKNSWAGLDLNTELWIKHFCNKNQVCLISQYCKEVLMEGKQISNSTHWGSLVIHILGILSKSGCTYTWVSVDVWLYVYYDFCWSLVILVLGLQLKSGYTCTLVSVEVWLYVYFDFCWSLVIHKDWISVVFCDYSDLISYINLQNFFFSFYCRQVLFR